MGSGRQKAACASSSAVDQDIERTGIGGSGFVGELLNHHFALGDLAAPALLGERHRLASACFSKVAWFWDQAAAPAGLPDWPSLKAGMPRRLAIGHLTVALRPGRRFGLSA
jgi:hypothetical protein